MQTSTTTAAPFTLVDEHWQSHLKLNGRAPRTLEALAIAKANDEHERRLREIKGMRDKLALLDALLPQLAALGVRFNYREFQSFSLSGGKELRLYPQIGSSFVDDKLHAALLAVGFREIERKAGNRDDQVKMKHGRSLVIVLDVSKPKAEPAAPTAAAAEPAPLATQS